MRLVLGYLLATALVALMLHADGWLALLAWGLGGPVALVICWWASR